MKEDLEINGWTVQKLNSIFSENVFGFTRKQAIEKATGSYGKTASIRWKELRKNGYRAYKAILLY